MSVAKYRTLNLGFSIPTVGLGTYLLPASQTADIVYSALKVGYRHFDSAVLYRNELEVGAGIMRWIEEDPANNKREDVFYTTKLWNSENGYLNAKTAIARCLQKVSGLKYIDLMLIHSPLEGSRKRLETWKALQEAVDEGTVKSIGVSNYGVHHIEELLSWPELKYKPAINQIEISPWIMRKELSDYCKSKGISVEAYAPFNHGGRFEDPTLVKIAKEHNVTTAQVLVRWNLQHGNIPLPKTLTISRLPSNLDVYDLSLNAEEMKQIDNPEAYEPSDWECTTAP